MADGREQSFHREHAFCFADNLRRLRTERGLSQQQLATKMFVNRSSIARWESGSRMPDLLLMIQMLFYGLLTIAACTVLAALVMFLFLLSDQQESFVRQTEENARKAFDIRILQMRPHFIYNAMTSIYYITEEDPEKGLKVIRDFSVYLRKVFNSVTRREPIPFAEELEHTRAYLAVEQARFEDKLNVTFDTAHIDFRLPPLTLQPIVENAVKHGMDPEIDRMIVIIRTRKLNGGSEITVENDGAVFSPSIDVEEGVGLGSARVRVENMCGGKLTITPRPAGGTTVTLFLPDDMPRRERKQQ